MMATVQCPMDEPKDQCEPWRVEVATAIAQAADGNDALAAQLVEIAAHESGLRKRIQACDCRRYKRTGQSECDWWRGVFLARSLWQVHDTGMLEPGQWRAMKGTAPEPLLLSARVALRIYQRNPAAFGRGARTGKRAQLAGRILGAIRAAREPAPARP